MQGQAKDLWTKDGLTILLFAYAAFADVWAGYK
jgi:hypothetical protein